MGSQRIESDDVPDIYPGGTKAAARAIDNDTPDVDLVASEKAESDLLDLMEALPDLKANTANYITPDNRLEFLDQDFYTAYNGKRLLGSKELTPKIDIVAGVIRGPIAVFRDIVIEPRARASSYMEYFIGLTRWADGTPALALAINHRDLIAKLVLARGLEEEREKIYSQISGLLVFSKF